MADVVPPDLQAWSCPLPLRDHDRVLLGHGGGGRLSAELIEHLFLPAFAQGFPPADVDRHDAATLVAEGRRLAFSTDAYVVRPLFFPGGCIGDLAVNGTINDLAMAGARPLALSAAFVLEEGLELATLGRVAAAMGAASRRAGVPIRTGDTKVVEVGSADGMYISTSGVGVIPPGVDIRPSRAEPGDVVILSGPIGLHGIAVLSQREGLEFGTDLVTDSAPLNHVVADLVAAVPDVHVLRDPTRGGVTASLCEIAAAAGAGIAYREALVPIPEPVATACSFLGLDPMTVANEGRFVAIVSPADADATLAVLRDHPESAHACAIGRVTAEHPGVVVAETRLGARRVVDLPLGEQLPRIC